VSEGLLGDQGFVLNEELAAIPPESRIHVLCVVVLKVLIA
jgi:hypothetical protein